MNQLSLTPFPIIITPRLVLRQPAPEDAPEIFLLRSDPQVNKYLERAKAASIDDALQFIQKINDSIHANQSFYWVITLKDQSKTIGCIMLWNLSKENNAAEIGYELLPDYQGRGIMQEAINHVLACAFDKLGLKKIQAWTHKENTQSSRLLERNNFSRDADAEEHAAAKGDIGSMIIYSRINSNT